MPDLFHDADGTFNLLAHAPLALDTLRMHRCGPLADAHLSVADQFAEGIRWRPVPSHAQSHPDDRGRRVLEERDKVYAGNVAWAPDADKWVPHGPGAVHDLVTGVVLTAQPSHGNRLKAGCFTRGVPNGAFRAVFPDGARFFVNLEYGEVVSGYAFFPSGVMYRGQLTANYEITGEGTLFLPLEPDPDGSPVAAIPDEATVEASYAKCHGRFDGGLRTGTCTTTFPDKTVVEAEFRDNKIVRGRVAYADGTEYEGGLVDERTPHGAGRVYDPEQKTWETGTFERGAREGVFVKRTPGDIQVSTTYRRDELVYGR